MSRSEIVNKSTTKDSPEVSAEPRFKVGKWYKCIDASGSILEKGKYYQVADGYEYGCLAVVGYARGYATERFDLNSECDFNPILEVQLEPKLDKQEEKVDNCSVTIVKGRTDSVNEPSGRYVYDTQLNNLFNQQEEINMTQVTTRKTVTVNLIDRDSALDEKYSLVASFGEFVTSKSPEALIRSIMINPENDVAGAIEAHNEIRIGQVDKDILKRTGNKVMLEPIEESDLYWEIL